MEIKYFFSKLAIFLILVIFILLLLLKSKEDKDLLLDVMEMSEYEDHAVYFLGSSRIRRAIDPQLIQPCLGNEFVFNLGTNSSDFISISFLAEHLLKQKGRNISLFIELVPIRDTIKLNPIRQMTDLNFSILDKIISPTYKKALLNETNTRFLLKRYYRNELKEVIYSLRNQFGVETKKNMGFKSDEGNDIYNYPNFLKTEDLIDGAILFDENSYESYYDIINYLTKLALEKDSKVVFFLPITYKGEIEKEETLPLYHSLNDSLKLKYTKTFVEQISDGKYLLDDNHFNIRGGQKFTDLFCPILETVTSGNK